MLFLSLKKNLTLVLIILLGFLLRFNNLTIGHPILYISNDEAIYHLSALNMIGSKTIFPLGNYGPLGSYLQVPFIILSYPILYLLGYLNSLKEFQILLLTQPGYLLFIPRMISAVFGVLSIIAIFFLSKQLFKDKKIALYSAIFFSLSFTLVHIAHQARSWSPAIFFSILAAIFAIKSIKSNKNELANTLLAFFFGAICFGFHQISGVVIILLLLIRFLNKPLVTKINLLALIFWVFLIAFFNFISLGGDFLKLANPADSTSGLVRDEWQLKSSSGIMSRLSSLDHYYVLWEFFISDPMVFLFSAVGLFLSRHNKIYLSFLIYILFNLVLSAFLFIPLMRYFLPSFTFLTIFAGYTLVRVLDRYNNKFLMILSIALLLFNSLYWNYLLTREPTFTSVRKWIDQNITVDTPIASTNRRNFDYSPTKNAGDKIREFKPGYYKRLADEIGNNYYPNVRNVIYINEFGEDTLENLNKAQKYYDLEYVIDSYPNAKERLYNNLDHDKYQLVAHFSPSKDAILEKNYPSILFDSAFLFNQYGLKSLFLIDRPGPYFDVIKFSK